MRKTCSVFYFSVILGALLMLPNAHAQSPSCSDLQHVNLGNGQVMRAATVSDDGSFPPYCKVEARLEPRTGADGRPYFIGFELRLPEKWNGKFLFQGGGGLDGQIAPPTGARPAGATPALARGYAVVSTDAGHQIKTSGAPRPPRGEPRPSDGPPGPRRNEPMDESNYIFGLEQEARLDYGYAALGKVTAASKQLVAAFYGKQPTKSYFAGCSNGGRQAMMISQRYPLDFDGIIGGDPGFRLSHAAIGQEWNNAALRAIAPHDLTGKPILSQALTQEDLDLVSATVLKQCDKLDGLEDGMVQNPLACHVSVKSLSCKADSSTQCLSPEKVGALERILGGAMDSHGNAIYSDFPLDAGISASGWRGWMLGSSPTAVGDSRNEVLGDVSAKYYYIAPFDKDIDLQHLDYDTIEGRIAATAAISDAPSTQISTFLSRGGKLILYHGMSDPVFSADDTIRYYKQLLADHTGAPNADSATRLFLVPGMNHCGGGPATDDFDALTALEKWVEQGEAPALIPATGKAFPGRSRPLCAFPTHAQYRGTGDPQNASSFECSR